LAQTAIVAAERGQATKRRRSVSAAKALAATAALLVLALAGAAVAEVLPFLVTIAPTPPYTDTSGLVTVTFSANDSPATFACTIDGKENPVGACTSPVTYTALPNGGHGFSVKGTYVDTAGETQTAGGYAKWVENVLPPTITITGGPAGGATVTEGTAVQFSYTSSHPYAAFSCAVDGADFVSCTPDMPYTLAPKLHTFAVRATDTYGAATTPTTTWTVAASQTAPPTVKITAGPSGTVTSTTATFEFTSGDPHASFECRFDSRIYRSCKSGDPYPTPRSDVYTFHVRAVSANGTPGPDARRGWTVAIAATGVPDTRITRTEIDGRDATFWFTATPATTSFECKIDTDSYAVCTSGGTFFAVVPGSHTFFVRARNSAGTDLTPATTPFTVAEAHTGGRKVARIVGPAVGGLVVIGVFFLLRARRRRLTLLRWQAEWKDKEPGETCTGNGTYTWRHGCKLTAPPRSIDKLPLAARAEPNRRLAHDVEGELVDALNHALHTARSRPERLAELLGPIAAGLAAEIDAWLRETNGVTEVDVEAHFTGGELECEFERFKCVAGYWVKQAIWKGKVEDESDEPVATVAFPCRDEEVARLERDLRAFVDRA
jgi:hypothetical protein